MAIVEWSDPAYADMARVLYSAIGISYPESRRQAVEPTMAVVWRRARAACAEVSAAAARAGVYGAWSMRGVPPEMIAWIAEPRGKSYVVRDRWRQRVEFAHGNLTGEVPPAPVVASGAMDLILCRNVLICLDEASVRRCAERLHAALRDGGFLLTSPTDPPLWDLAPFATRTTSAGIVYCRQEARPAREPAAVFAVAAERSWS